MSGGKGGLGRCGLSRGGPGLLGGFACRWRGWLGRWVAGRGCAVASTLLGSLSLGCWRRGGSRRFGCGVRPGGGRRLIVFGRM